MFCWLGKVLAGMSYFDGYAVACERENTMPREGGGDNGVLSYVLYVTFPLGKITSFFFFVVLATRICRELNSLLLHPLFRVRGGGS